MANFQTIWPIGISLYLTIIQLIFNTVAKPETPNKILYQNRSDFNSLIFSLFSVFIIFLDISILTLFFVLLLNKLGCCYVWSIYLFNELNTSFLYTFLYFLLMFLCLVYFY